MQCRTRQAEPTPTKIVPEISSDKHAIVYQVRLRDIDNRQVCTSIVCKQACFVMPVTDVRLSDHEYTGINRIELKPSLLLEGSMCHSSATFLRTPDTL